MLDKTTHNKTKKPTFVLRLKELTSRTIVFEVLRKTKKPITKNIIIEINRKIIFIVIAFLTILPNFVESFQIFPTSQFQVLFLF